MRDRSEILADGLEAVKAETVPTQSDLKLTLLILEVLVDFRDIWKTYVNSGLEITGEPLIE